MAHRPLPGILRLWGSLDVYKRQEQDIVQAHRGVEVTRFYQQIRVIYDSYDMVTDYLVDCYNSHSRETYDIIPVTTLDLSPCLLYTSRCV